MWNASASVPGRARGRGDRERDALGLAGLVQQLEDRGSQRRAAREHRPAAELVAPELLLVDARRSVANVTSTTIAMSGRSEYAVVRAPPNVISSCVTATAYDVAGRAARLGHEPRRLERDEAAEPVVHRARDERGRWAARPARRRSPRRRRCARASAPRRRPARRCRCAGPSAAGPSCARPPSAGGSASCRRRRARRPSRVAISTRWPTRIDRIPAADAGEPEEAVVVDVVDDQADLVDVADDGERRAVAGAGHARDGRADGVVGDLGEGGRRPRGRRRPAACS